MIRIYKGNTSPSVTDTIKVNGLAFDLTGATVKFQMRQADSSALVIDRAASVVSAVAGTVRYDWQSSDTTTTGEYAAWWHVTLPSTATQDTSEFAVEIIDHAELSTSVLCNIEDVRRELELDQTDTSRDDLIEWYIPAASSAIIDEYQREFVPTSTAVTRRFEFSSYNHIDLAPYDLRSVTSVVIGPETTVPTTLTTDQYTLWPVTPKHNVYTSLRLSRWVTLDPTSWIRYGTHYVDVTGNWGWPSIPPNVRRACSLTVASWMRRDFGSLNLGDVGDVRDADPETFGTPVNFSIPPAARRMLQPFRRSPFF